MVKQKDRGALLVITLWVSVILLVTGLALWVDGTFRRVIKTNTKDMFLAEAGLEYARAVMQNDLTLRNSQSITGSQILQFSSGGNNVEYFPASAAGNIPQEIAAERNNVHGLALTEPVYDASGNIIGNQVAGYFAYLIFGRGPIDVYSIGCSGASPTQIASCKTIHAKLKPFTYTEYAGFAGNPAQNLVIRNSYVDPFFNTATVRSTTSSSNYSATSILSAGNRRTSFNRSYIAGNLNINITTPTDTPDFFGFDLGAYYVPKSTSSVSTANDIFVASTDQLWTDPNQAIGMPNPIATSGTSEVQSLMDQFQTIANPGIADQGGVFLEGNRSMLLETNNTYYSGSNPYNNRYVADSEDPGNTKYIPQDSFDDSYNGPCPGDTNAWDPTTIKRIITGGYARESTNWSNGFYCTGDRSGTRRYNRPYTLEFGRVNSSGIGVVRIGNVSATNENGPSGNRVINVNGNACSGSCNNMEIALDSLESPIIYVKGNVEVRNLPTTSSYTGGVQGKITIIAEGKITVTGNLTYADQTIAVSSGGTTVSPQKSSNMLGLLTPRKVEISPYTATAAQNMQISAAIMETGSNPTGDSAQDSKWTLQLNPVSPQYDAGDGPYNSITFFGSQIYFSRNANWKNFYRNGRASMSSTVIPGNPFQIYDTNLLKSQPPFSPTLSRGYNVVYWAEVNPINGQDVRYH